MHNTASNNIFSECTVLTWTQLVMKPLQLANIGDEQAALASDRAAKAYVRGEEDLGGWRPRSDSIIAEHAAQMDRQHKMAQLSSLKQQVKSNIYS